PSEENADEPIIFWCPSRVRSSLPVATSQRRIALGFPAGLGRDVVLSLSPSSPEASVLPSGEKAIVLTSNGCSSLWSSLPLDTSHRRTTFSSPPPASEASVLLSGEKKKKIDELIGSSLRFCRTHS